MLDGGTFLYWLIFWWLVGDGDDWLIGVGSDDACWIEINPIPNELSLSRLLDQYSRAGHRVLECSLVNLYMERMQCLSDGLLFTVKIVIEL